MKITENKNWYLVWIAALLLLTLGKVYEWAFPGFEHDYNHFLRNRIESEIAGFESGTQKTREALQQQIKKENGSRTDWTILQHFLIGSQEHHVICSNQTIRFWSGGQAFYDPHWCLDEENKPLTIFQHYGNYYLQSAQPVLLDSSWYQWVQITPIRSANQSRETFEIATRKTGDSKLEIRDSKNGTLGYLQMDAPFLAPYYGNILIVYYILVLFLFYLPFHRIARNFYAQKNFPWANLVLVSGVLVTASMCQWIVHQNEFYHSILTDKLIRTRFYHYTLFEFSVFSGIFFHITYFFYKYAKLSANKTGGWFATTIVLSNYLASIFSLVIYCFIFNAVFIHSDYYFDLNNVFSFTLQHYILLFDLLIILVAIFLITNKLTLSTNTFGFSLQKRLAFYLISCIAITPLLYQSNIEIGLVSFFLGATIIIWMQDFFSEDYQKNILWLISWIIVISILNSSLIFHYQNQKKRYIKNQLVSQYLECESRQQPECLANLIQNCSTNYFDLYYFEDHLLKFSSNVFKPGYEQSLKYLRQDTIRHVIQEGRDVLYHKPNPNRLLVISNPLESTLKGVSLFSYLFTILIVISYLLSLVHQKLQFLPADLQITFQDKPSLKNRIQFYVILGIVISFLIIALTTVFFTRRSENQIFRENLISKSKNLCAFLESAIEHAPQMEDAKTILMTQLRQSSLMVDFTVKLYDAGGREEKVFDSPLMRSGIQGLLDPQFYFRYPAFAEDIVVLERRQPETTFNAYRNIFFNNQRIGIVEVEAIASQQYKSTDRLANLINTLLNIYVFLFLIAASLATLLANSITSPLVNLGEKIRQIRLGKTNEKLEWSGQDEIGELIGNYNQMVGQLDESAQLLAKSERDSAWREMAKQVAHEIKNPLTPMKLSIQYLQQSIRSGSDDIREMAEKVSHTLIEQIDNLTKIATEFSNFAKMPQAENEKLILNEIVSSVHDLFRKREDLDILLSVPIDELFVFADKNQIIRVLNNLINNAIQAIPETRRGRIEISLDSNVRNAVICVTDNGTGIPEDLQSKVFLPNFTSKSSGTGLGLAMCQQIIESANGRIYFRTVPGKGTSFYIELPLMRIPLPEESDESPG